MAKKKVEKYLDVDPDFVFVRKKLMLCAGRIGFKDLTFEFEKFQEHIAKNSPYKLVRPTGF